MNGHEDWTVMGSIFSYLLATAGIVITLSPDIEFVTLLVSLGILALRLIYDAIRLWRYITRK
jgi:hypothetical protein